MARNMNHLVLYVFIEHFSEFAAGKVQKKMLESGLRLGYVIE